MTKKFLGLFSLKDLGLRVPDNPTKEDIDKIKSLLDKAIKEEVVEEELNKKIEEGRGAGDKYKAIVLDYKSYCNVIQNKEIICPKCHHKTNENQLLKEHYETILFDLSCPKCEKMLFVVT